MYARRGRVAVHFDTCDNTLAGNSNFTYNAYNCSKKVANVTKLSVFNIDQQTITITIMRALAPGLEESQTNKRISNQHKSFFTNDKLTVKHLPCIY